MNALAVSFYTEGYSGNIVLEQNFGSEKSGLRGDTDERTK